MTQVRLMGSEFRYDTKPENIEKLAQAFAAVSREVSASPDEIILALVMIIVAFNGLTSSRYYEDLLRQVAEATTLTNQINQPPQGSA